MILFDRSEYKEETQQNIEVTPQTTPLPSNSSATRQTPNPNPDQQQPDVDEDGYCIQPKSPLWEASKKGIFI